MFVNLQQRGENLLVHLTCLWRQPTHVFVFAFVVTDFYGEIFRPCLSQGLKRMGLQRRWRWLLNS